MKGQIFSINDINCNYLYILFMYIYLNFLYSCTNYLKQLDNLFIVIVTEEHNIMLYSRKCY